MKKISYLLIAALVITGCVLCAGCTTTNASGAMDAGSITEEGAAGNEANTTVTADDKQVSPVSAAALRLADDECVSPVSGSTFIFFD